MGGEDTDFQHDTLSGPAGSHLPAGPHRGLQSFRKDRIFLYNYFVTEEDDKAIFPIPGDTAGTIHVQLFFCLSNSKHLLMFKIEQI